MFCCIQLTITQGKEGDAQLLLRELNQLAKPFDLNMSCSKTKDTFCGRDIVRSKVVVDDRIMKQMSHFNYLGSDIICQGWGKGRKMNKFHL